MSEKYEITDLPQEQLEEVTPSPLRREQEIGQMPPDIRNELPQDTTLPDIAETPFNPVVDPKDIEQKILERIEKSPSTPASYTLN